MKSRVVWLLLCLIWGSTWLFIKLGLDDLPPFTFAGIRFVIASAILFAIIKARRLTLPRTRADWILLAVTGVLSFSLNYGLLFWGEQYISSGLAALLQATIPAFGFVFAHVYLPGERMLPVRELWWGAPLWWLAPPAQQQLMFWLRKMEPNSIPQFSQADKCSSA